LKIIVRDLQRKREPIAYNYSACQDRPGFATAMILSGLGVPRDVINPSVGGLQLGCAAEVKSI
jgi:protein-tyrosine phosphatase